MRSDGSYERVVVETTDGVLPPTNSDEWLASMPRGAYINARTFGRDSIYQFDFHMQKLATSIESMREKEEDEALEEEVMMKEGLLGGAVVGNRLVPSLTPPPTAADVESVVRPMMVSALTRYYRDEFPDHAGEIKLCIHVSWGDNPRTFALPPMPPSHLAAHDLVVTCLAAPLALAPARPVVAALDGVGRDNAAAKDSTWAATRLVQGDQGDPVEDEGVRVEERLLMDAKTGDVLEGASSNVFAVIGGEVYTAEEGVLQGSVRATVLEACAENGVTVRLTPPPGGARGITKWDGAVISSTSRLAVPLDAVLVPRHALLLGEQGESTRDTSSDADVSSSSSPFVRVELDAGPDSLAAKIATWVEAKVGAASVKITDAL